jgi:AraC-like DNA-binding protein
VAERVLASITYWNQFIRYSEEQNIALNYESINSRLVSYQNQDFIPFDDFKYLVHEIAETSSRKGLGLDFAERIQLASHGSLGFAISHGVDLNECLELISRYYQTRMQAIKISNKLENNEYVLSIHENCDWHPIRTLLYEVLLSSLLNVIKFVIGKEVSHCSAHFPFPAPSWQKKYHELLPCTVQFDQPEAAIRIPLALLSITSATANPRSIDFARTQCDQELTRLNQFSTLSEKVSSLIENRKDYSITIEEAAHTLNMSKSTLARKLKQEQNSYSDILSNLRKQQARSLLLNTNSSIESIALSLGYDDASNFTRSFKRWFECSPAQFRNQQSH